MKKIPIYYLILFFTVVVIHIFANEAGQNMLMLGVMGYCAILLPSRIRRTDAWDLLPILIFVIMFCSQYIHPKEFRLSTVLYSAMFMIQCVVFRTYLNETPFTVYYQSSEKSIKTVDLTCINEQGETVDFMPLEGIMHVETSSDTIKPLLDMEVPVEAITQNLNSFASMEE